MPPSPLPHLPTIFERLRMGYHFSRTDGEPYVALCDHFDAYQSLFADLGLDLRRHNRDFVYLHADPDKSVTTTTRKIVLFVLVLIDDASNRGEAVVEGLLNTTLDVDVLPHLDTDRYASYMRQIGVEDASGLRSVVSSMEKLGYARTLTTGTFELLPPVYRVFDLCHDAVDDGSVFDASAS